MTIYVINVKKELSRKFNIIVRVEMTHLKRQKLHESGYRILPTQPHMGPGDFQVTCTINQDVFKMSDGYLNVVIR